MKKCPGTVKYGKLPEQLLDVVTGFGRRFDEHDVELFGFPLALLRRHLSLVAQIGLVPDLFTVTKNFLPLLLVIQVAGNLYFSDFSSICRVYFRDCYAFDFH